MFAEVSGKMIDSEECTRTERNQDKFKFYSLMGTLGFDFEDIDNSTKLPKSLVPVVENKFEAMLLFNDALMKLHRNRLITITDAVIYLTEDYFEAKDVLKILQTINLNYLQNDLRDRYNINKEELVNKFADFIN